ncbi:MAG: hypothetical protein AAB587_01570 [Patescibacteria group bacterium]
MTSADVKKYLVVFFITALIFFTAISLANSISDKKLEEIRAIEDRVAIDILSSETQFSLLAESSCDAVNTPLLSEELSSLGNKLAFAEEERGSKDPEVRSLKKSYSLLLIKDYLLMKRISEKCKINPVSILYFYSNEGECGDCEREGYVLTHLQKKYPQLRIYAFDYHLPLSAVKTLIVVKKVENDLPALVINEKQYYGFQSVEDIEKAVPALAVLASSTPTGTE